MACARSASRTPTARPSFLRQSSSPHAAAERGHVELRVVLRVKHHAMSPLEIESGNSLPGETTVGRAPHRLLEAGGIEHRGVGGVDRHVVNVLVIGEDAATT